MNKLIAYLTKKLILNPIFYLCAMVILLSSCILSLLVWDRIFIDEFIKAGDRISNKIADRIADRSKKQ